MNTTNTKTNENLELELLQGMGSQLLVRQRPLLDTIWVVMLQSVQEDLDLRRSKISLFILNIAIITSVFSEHRKHEDERGLGQTTTDPTTTSSGHHLGRDATIGAGGVGLAEQ